MRTFMLRCCVLHILCDVFVVPFSDLSGGLPLRYETYICYRLKREQLAVCFIGVLELHLRQTKFCGSVEWILSDTVGICFYSNAVKFPNGSRAAAVEISVR